MKVVGGHTSGAKRRKKIFFVPLHFFASQIMVVLVSAFVMVSTVWFAVFYTRCLRAQPFVKVPGNVASVPYGVGADVCIQNFIR